MRIPKYLLYSLLLSVFLVSAKPYEGGLEDCDGVKVEVLKTDTKNNASNGRVEIINKGNGRAKLQFIFCKGTGEVLNEGSFQKSTFEQLAAGEYYCVVVSKDCHKKLKITIL
jgi:hypothetical protein